MTEEHSGLPYTTTHRHGSSCISHIAVVAPIVLCAWRSFCPTASAMLRFPLAAHFRIFLGLTCLPLRVSGMPLRCDIVWLVWARLGGCTNCRLG